MIGTLNESAGRNDLGARDANRAAGQGHRLAIIRANEDLAGLERLHDDAGAVEDRRGHAVRDDDVAFGRTQTADRRGDGLVLVGIAGRLVHVLAIGRTRRLDAHDGLVVLLAMRAGAVLLVVILVDLVLLVLLARDAGGGGAGYC